MAIPFADLPPRLRILVGVAVLLAAWMAARWISEWGLVTVHVQDAPLGSVLSSIARQGHVRIESSLDPLRKVTLDVDKVTPAEALDILAGNTGAVWRNALLAAPAKAMLESAVLSLRAGGGIDGWTIRHYPSPPFLDTGAEIVDPGKVSWTPEGPGLELSSLLDEAAQKTGLLTASPDSWSPSVPRLPKEGQARSVVPAMVASAGGRSLTFLFLTERPRRDPGSGDRPPGDSSPNPTGEASSSTGNPPGGPGRPSQIRPEWMAQRLVATARSLPKTQREKALKEVDELKPILDQLKTLPPEERRAKMRELMANPAFADKMADRMLVRDSRRSADQRITRAVGYLNRKASLKASGQ